MKTTFNFFKSLGVLAVLAAMIFIQACSDDPNPIKPGESGFFIVNEGAWGNSNTSLSYYDRQTDEVTNDLIFNLDHPLGDQSQSMTVFEGKGYIAVQNSSKVEVIDVNTFTWLTTISEDLSSPRYFLGISSNKAYVSDWGADGLTGTVKVIDLSTSKVTKTISTGSGANQMLKVGDQVYVTNSGGYGKDNTVKVIDTNSDAIVATIPVGDNPNSIQVDNDGNIWVASSGATVYNDDWSVNEENSTKGSISKIDASNTEVLRLSVDNIFSSPKHLNISTDGRKLYYLYNGGIYTLSTSATSLPATAFKEKDYYGLAVDPFNDNIIGSYAPNFSSAGSIDVYDEAGNLLRTKAVGIGPNGFAFK
jgi:YVTN family beta-propeller protein